MMNDLLIKLRACSRQLELEDSIPYWENQRPELRARISEMTGNLRQKEQELTELENPGFFQKLLGRTEEKKGRLNKQLREITSARMAAQWELEALNKKIESGRQELKTLSDSWEVYQTARKTAILTTVQESRLMMEEISAFAPAALETAGRILEMLEAARPWLEQENRNTEQLYNIEAAANRLHGILSVLPEGVATVGSFLCEPHEYLCGADLLDRLNQAQEQVQRIINQLRLLLGE